MRRRECTLAWSALKPGLPVWVEARLVAEQAGVDTEDLTLVPGWIRGMTDPRAWDPEALPWADVGVAGVPHSIRVGDLADLSRREKVMQMDWVYLLAADSRLPDPEAAVVFRLHLEARSPDDPHDTGMRAGVYLGKNRWAAPPDAWHHTREVACWKAEEPPRILRKVGAA